MTIEFELLTSSGDHRGLFTDLEMFFRNRRRQLQDWDSQPPHLLGFLILVLTSIELTVAHRLFASKGLDVTALSESVGIFILLLLGESVLSKIGTEVAAFLKKKGNFWTSLTFMSISLAPLLLLLPFTLLAYLTGKFSILHSFLALLLMFRVLANWREALEICFEFSKLQSLLVMYALFGVMVAGLVLFLYVSLITMLTSFLN